MKDLSEIKNWEEMINEVICGDCLEGLKLIPDNSIELVLTDPPYGINKDEWDKEYPKGFEKECLRIAKTVAIMCGQWAIPLCLEELKQSYVGIIALHNKNGMTYSPLGFGNWIPVIIAGERPKSGQDLISFIVRGDKPMHPSPKPIESMLYLVKRLSKENDLVLDPFMGSWTTARACKDLGRNFIGFEINKEYCKIGEQRLQQQNLF